MRRLLLIGIYCICYSFLQGQSISMSVNCQTDTSFNLYLGGLLDGFNYQQPHMYTAASWPDYKRLPVNEPMDSFRVSNNGLTDLTTFQLICGENNIYQIDGLAQSAIPGPLPTAQDSINQLYRYVANHNFYFYVPEMESREFKEVTRHFGIYGYGHCGSIANCAALLGKKLFGSGQRFWLINNEDHGIAEIYSGGKYYYVDADEEMMVKGRNNKSYISLGEAYEDLFLFYRTKAFGANNFYAFDQSAGYASLRYFNRINHTFSESYPNHYGNCYVNDTLGNYGPELYYYLKSGEQMTVTRYKDSDFSFHHRPGSYCSNGPYGYLPEQNTVFPAIYSVKTHYDLFSTNQQESEKLDSKTNTSFSFAEHKVKPTSTNSPVFTVKRLSRFPLTGGQLNIGGTFSDNSDSLQVFVSFNGTTWIWMNTLTLFAPSANIPLDSFIKPNSSLAKYPVYFKVKFFVTGNPDEAELNEFNWDLRYQVSRYLFPTLRLGNNNVQLKLSGNLQPGQVSCDLFWKENSQNNLPQPPQFPIFPVNGSTLNKTDIRFRWEQINTDAEGDSIQEWQFQLSEYPDFRTVLANNFDYCSLLKEGRKAYFYNYFDTLRARNTFFSHNSTYYWRIRVRDVRNAWSDWSNTWQFTVQAPQAVRNTHFELIPSNTNQLLIKWNKASNDNLASSYHLLMNGNPTSLYFHPTQITNFYPTTNEFVYNVDSSRNAFRVFARDNAGNCSPPASVITLPVFTQHQIDDTLDLSSLMDSLQHPFPNYPSLQRNYFLLYDTTFFESVNNSSIHSKQKGRTLVSICYQLDDDTIYKKQLLLQVQDYANLNAICGSTGKFVTIDAPITFPIQITYQLNGNVNSQTLLTPTDSIFLAYGDSLFVEQIWNNTDTMILNQSLVNHSLPMSLTWNDLPLNCSTVQAELNLNVNGVSPLICSFVKNGNADSILLNQGTNILSFDNGVYDFVEVRDSFHCSIPMNAHREYNHDTLEFSSDPIHANCANLQMEMPVHLEGNGPWTIFYTPLSGIPDSFVTSQGNDTIPLPNDQYFFSHITDSAGCDLNVSFFQNVNYIPLSISTDTVAINCVANNQSLKIHSTGIYPIRLFHEWNGIADSSWIPNNDYDYIMNNGLHYFSYVKDTEGCVLNFDSTYYINHHPLSYSIDLPYYNCDSQKTLIQIYLQGNSPFTLYYRKSGIPFTLTSTNPQFNLFLDDSEYYFDSVRGGTCVIPVSAPNLFYFPYDSPQLFFSNVKMNCLNDSMYVDYQLLGGTVPFQLNGYYNGNAFTKTLYSNLGKITLLPGVYQFDSFYDSTGCFHSLNTTLTANLQPLQAQAGQPVYQCGNATYKTPITLSGTPPFTLYYRKNQIDSSLVINTFSFDLFLTNGTYFFDSVKDEFCTRPVYSSYTYQFNSSVFNTTVQPVSYDCSTGTSNIVISPSGGLPPYRLVYTYNGNADSIQLSGTYQMPLINGTYVLQNIHDSYGCNQNLFVPLTISTTPLQSQLSTPVYVCDSGKTKIVLTLTGNPPYTIFYRKNGIAQSVSTSFNNYTFYFPNGTYQMDSVQDFYCTKPIPNVNTFTFNYTPIVAAVGPVQYNCNTNQSYRIVTLTGGTPPYMLHFTRNGIPDSMQTSSSITSWYVPNGNYVLSDVKDLSSCSILFNETFSVNNQPLSCVVSNPAYQCDSNKTKLDFTFQGNAPFTIYYRKNNVNLQYTTSQPNAFLMLVNGNYSIDSFHDQTCRYIPSQPLTYTFNYSTQPFTASIISLPYQCDSAHHHIQVNASGNPPYQLHFTYNSVSQTQYFSQNSLHKNLVNGNYVFTSITDTSGCTVLLNQNLVINSTPLSWSSLPPTWSCDSNKTRWSFQFNGTAPWKIYYRKNNIPSVVTTSVSPFNWYLNNGTYILDSVVDAYCSKPFTSSNQYTFNGQPLVVSYTTPVFDCDSAKMKMSFTLLGNPPFSLYTSLNGINDTMVFNSSSWNLYLPNGNNIVKYIKDASNCSFPIYESYNLNEAPLSVTYGTPVYNCSSNQFDLNLSFTGTAPYTIYLSHNGINSTVTTSASNYSLHLNEGTWQVIKVMDNRNCSFLLNQTHNIPHTNYLNYQLVYNQFDCGLKKHKTQLVFSGNYPCQIYYRQVLPQPYNYVYTITSDTATFLFNNGYFVIDSVKDTYSCLDIINLGIIHNLDSLSYSLTSSVYDCDSAKMKFNFSFHGQGPWTLQYKNLSNNAVSSVLFTQINGTMFLPYGQYALESLSDFTCSQTLHDTLTNSYAPLQTSMSALNYSCALGKFYIAAHGGGGLSPYVLQYTKNGQPYTFTVGTTSDTLLLDQNSTYIFNKIVDAIGCEKLISQTYNTTYNDPLFQPVTFSYNCSKDSTLATFHVINPDSVYLVYEWNQTGPDTLKMQQTSSRYLPNGTYHWMNFITKFGCILPIDSFSVIDEHPNTMDILSSEKDCEGESYRYTFAGHGKWPVTLNYLRDGIASQLSLSDTLSTYDFSSGIYQFQNTVDLNGCTHSINQTDTLKPFTPNHIQPVISDYIITVEPTNMFYIWYKNDSMISPNPSSSVPYSGNGTYYAEYIDSAGCARRTIPLEVHMPLKASIYPNPVTTDLAVSFNENIAFWEFEIRDITGKKIAAGLVDGSGGQVSVAHLAKGFYYILIRAKTLEEVHRFLKN